VEDDAICILAIMLFGAGLGAFLSQLNLRATRNEWAARALTDYQRSLK
jgi:hypothetical protein